MLTPDQKRWFPNAKPTATSTLRMFCLPYAGGSASVFRLWPQHLPPRIEVWAAQPPGRETRFTEPAFSHPGAYLDALMLSVRPLLEEKPFVFFGHSMGAILTFELTRRLRAEGLRQPLRLFVSGKDAPHLPAKVDRAHLLPEPEFIDYLRKLGGTPPEVIANKELRELVFPILRRDFQLLHEYKYQAEAPLEVPMRAFGGTTDHYVAEKDLAAWAEHSRRFLGMRLFPGGHLFLNEQRLPLVQAIEEDLRELP